MAFEIVVVVIRIPFGLAIFVIGFIVQAVHHRNDAIKFWKSVVAYSPSHRQGSCLDVFATRAAWEKSVS